MFALKKRVPLELLRKLVTVLGVHQLVDTLVTNVRLVVEFVVSDLVV